MQVPTFIYVQVFASETVNDQSDWAFLRGTKSFTIARQAVLTNVETKKKILDLCPQMIVKRVPSEKPGVWILVDSPVALPIGQVKVHIVRHHDMNTLIYFPESADDSLPEKTQTLSSTDNDSERILTLLISLQEEVRAIGREITQFRNFLETRGIHPPETQQPEKTLQELVQVAKFFEK